VTANGLTKKADEGYGNISGERQGLDIAVVQPDAPIPYNLSRLVADELEHVDDAGVTTLWLDTKQQR